MIVFDRWVSLGSFCLPRFQINRMIAVKYFGQVSSTVETHSFMQTVDRSTLRSINGGTCILDWTVVNDYEKVIHHITEGFQNYSLDASLLRSITNSIGAVNNVECTSLGVLFPHLFSHENNYANWRDEVSVLKPKVDHMIQSFIGLKEFTTLYVMTASLSAVQAGIPNRLVTALKSLRGNDAPDFRLMVCIEGDSLPSDDGRMIMRNYPVAYDYPDYPWFGHAESWDNMFRGVELSAPLR